MMREKRLVKCRAMTIMAVNRARPRVFLSEDRSGGEPRANGNFRKNVASPRRFASPTEAAGGPVSSPSRSYGEARKEKMRYEQKY